MPPIIVHTTQPRSGNPNEGGTGPLSKDDGTAYCLDTGNTQAIEIKSAALRTRGEKGEKGRKKKLEIRDDNIANAVTTHQLDSIAIELKTYGIIPESDKPQGNWLPRERVLESEEGLARAISTSESQHPYYKINIIDKKGKKKNNQDHASCLAGGAHSGGNHSDMDLLKKENRIRRLTPTECERLQGFPDGWTDGQSNTQRYKQLGNAVSVPVIKAIMERIFDES